MTFCYQAVLLLAQSIHEIDFVAMATIISRTKIIECIRLDIVSGNWR